MHNELVGELRQVVDHPFADLCNRAADAIESGLSDLHDAMEAHHVSPHSTRPQGIVPSVPCPIPCRIIADRSGIYLRLQGYGDCDSADGQGCPAMIEFFGGECRVVIWNDINSDEPLIVSLEGAKEDGR